MNNECRDKVFGTVSPSNLPPRLRTLAMQFFECIFSLSLAHYSRRTSLRSIDICLLNTQRCSGTCEMITSSQCQYLPPLSWLPCSPHRDFSVMRLRCNHIPSRPILLEVVTVLMVCNHDKYCQSFSSQDRLLWWCSATGALPVVSLAYLYDSDESRQVGVVIEAERIYNALWLLWRSRVASWFLDATATTAACS
jgi:hypothetical protein